MSPISMNANSQVINIYLFIKQEQLLAMTWAIDCPKWDRPGGGEKEKKISFRLN